MSCYLVHLTDSKGPSEPRDPGCRTFLSAFTWTPVPTVVTTHGTSHGLADFGRVPNLCVSNTSGRCPIGWYHSEYSKLERLARSQCFPVGGPSSEGLLQTLSCSSQDGRNGLHYVGQEKKLNTIGTMPACASIVTVFVLSCPHDLRQVICRYSIPSSPWYRKAYLPVTGMTMITKVVVHIRRPLLHWA